MKYIVLPQNKYTYIDDEDYDWLNQWNWHITKGNGGFYAKRDVIINHRKYHIYMHNEIIINRMELEIPPKHECHHIDFNGLNNQRLNLKVTTKSLNCYYRRLKSDNTSGVKGVHQRLDKSWEGGITINCIRETKQFKTKEEAIAYRKYLEERYRLD